MGYFPKDWEKDYETQQSIEEIQKFDSEMQSKVALVDRFVAEELLSLMSSDATLNIPRLMKQSRPKLMKTRTSLRWSIEIASNFWGLYFNPLLFFQADVNGVTVKKLADGYRKACFFCCGSGQTSNPWIQGGPPLVLPTVSKRIVPKTIHDVDRAILVSVDVMRGKGRFDNMLRKIERLVREMRKPLGSFNVTIISKVYRAERTIAVARLMPISLMPRQFHKNICAASWLEWCQMTGKKLRHPKVLYMLPCTHCEATGLWREK